MSVSSLFKAVRTSWPHFLRLMNFTINSLKCDYVPCLALHCIIITKFYCFPNKDALQFGEKQNDFRTINQQDLDTE